MTQRECIEKVLLRHGCSKIFSPSTWHKWSTGDIIATPNNFFFVGPSGGFRFGRSRTASVDYPKLKARLMAEKPELLI